MEDLETLLTSLKEDWLGIEFLQTVNGREIKGYHNGGKIYFDSINCIELAEIFLKIARHLESVDENFSNIKFNQEVGQRISSLFINDPESDALAKRPDQECR